MYQGKTHLCVYMNFETQIAHVKRASLKYFTSIIDHVTVYVKGENNTAFGMTSNEQLRCQGSLARVGPATVGVARGDMGVGQCILSVSFFFFPFSPR